MGQALKRAPRRGVAAKRSQVVGSKGGSSKPKQPSIASNSVPSIATVRMLYLWSWGPIVGPVNDLRSVKLDGTPVMAEDGTLNYPGVKWQFRSGDLNQEPMTGVSESSNEIAVGQQLLSTTPYIYTITNSMLDAVRLRFSWPQLQSQDSGGNVDGVRIEYAIDVSTDNGPYQQVLASEVNRKNVTKYERSHRIELPPGSRWAIRARRITPERNSSLVQDGMYVEAIAEVVDSDQEYPLTAVSCVEYDAEQFGGDIAKIAVLMRGRIVRVPMNYDPETRTYATGGPGTTNGVWDGTFKEAYTNNPAWVFYDLALHPYYGLGDRIDPSMVNRWSLYRIGQYCDQMVPDGKGGEEPRFTCNLYLQKQAEAWAVLQDLAAIFHGLAFWDGSQITVNADMPQDPVYNYTLSQILDDGAVKYTGSKLRERHSQAMVSFDDPDRGYDTDKEPVFDEDAIAEYGVREISVEAVGCTSRGQAQRAGQWALMTEQLQLRGASFRVGLDGYIPKPGKVITLSDPMLAGRANGGRIAAVAGRVVTVDRDIDVPSGARLLVNLPSGKSEARQVRSVDGRQITVMADFSEAPQAECAWVLDFDDLKLMQFYVRNVTRPEWHQFQLECIQYEPSKFDAIDYGTVIDDRPISVLPAGVQDAPARVLISSHSAVDQGIAVTTMTISWDAAPGAVAYDVEWRWGSRDWVKMPRTGELAADVRGVYAGQYLARVRAVSAMDVSSIPTTSVLTNVTGKATPPPAVTHLTTKPLVYAIGLSWGFPAGAEDTQRTEIWQSATTSRNDATKLGDFTYPQAEHEIHGLAAGVSFFYWARLVDRSGNIGPWYPAGVGVNGQSSSNRSEYEEYFKDKISNGALYPALRQEIELISGPPSTPGSVNARIQDLGEQVTEITDQLGTQITQAQQDLQQQIDTIADLADSMPYKPDQAYTAGQGVLGEDGKLYQAKVDVPAGNPPPNATFWTDIGQAVQTANGLAARVTTVETKVTEQDGKLAAESTRIDGVQSSLATTNQNVNAAQQAAQDAATLAGGKGKVIVQSAAPAAADRLAQNLWIDTTGNANTPKRWNGSAWSAVTDKVATDAAAAAANALSVAQTKADATVVDSLSSKVNQQGDTLTSQGQALTGVQNSLTTTNQNVTAAQQAAQAASDAAGAKGKVLYQSPAPAVADRLAQNLWIDTTGNANTPKRWNGTAWAAVTDKVSTDAAAAAANALSVAQTKADASTVSALSNTVAQQGTAITAQGAALTNIQASIGQQSDNLLQRGSFEDGLTGPWTGNPTVETVTVAGTSAGKAIAFTTNSFGGAGTPIMTAPGQQFDLSADVCREFMTAEQSALFQMQFYDKAAGNLGYLTAFSVPAGGAGFQGYSGRITAPAGAVSARFVTRTQPSDGVGRSLWANMIARRVTAADAANASATSVLDGRVTQTEAGLTAQGAAVTQIQSTIGGIGGTGSNQMPAEYSVYSSLAAPLMIVGTGLTPSMLADSATQGGYALKFTSNDTTIESAVYMHTSNSPGVLGAFPMSYLNGKYIVSFYAKSNVTGRQVRFWLRALNSAASAQNPATATVTVTDTWARYSAVIDLSNAAKFSGNRMVFAVQPNFSGVSGTEISFDRIMVEKQIGTSTEPSVYVTGNSANAIRVQATGISQMGTVVEQQGTAITAQASRLDGLYVQVNPEMEGDSTGLAGATGGLVGVWTEQSARVEDGIAMGRQVETVQAQMGQTNASVQQVSEVVAGVDGKVSAISSWKTETNASGKKVATGIIQGSDGIVGEILLSADRVAIINGLNGPEASLFVFQDGQLFLNSALINQAFIQSLVVGMTLRSQAVNTQGLPLIEINLASGSFTVRGQDANGSTLLNNGGLYVYDANGIERTAVGRLT